MRRSGRGARKCTKLFSSEINEAGSFCYSKIVTIVKDVDER